jgi:hypothetical protein
MICALVLQAIGILGYSSGAQQGAPEGAEGFYESLALHYAPVIRQGAVSEQDYITTLDFDGDWIGNNNWENMPHFELRAYVYYSVIESNTHWFLFYSLFHPRDYTLEDCAISGGCHENDLESIQLTVEKDSTPFGKPKALETLTHASIYLYTFDESVGSGFLRVAGTAELEDGHPLIYVEALGHGIYGHARASSLTRLSILSLFGGGIVTYRVGEQAEVPENVKDENVSYKLVPIHTTLWSRRDIGDGRTVDRPFEYRGHVLPTSIDGDTFSKDRANTPWGYYQARGATLSQGDWFLDPARAVSFHASFAGDFSLEYLRNLYLRDLQCQHEQ